MARGSQQATTAATTAATTNAGLQSNANAIYSSLAPTLEQEAAAPAGLSPVDLAAENTAAQQSAGGSEAGAVGQGGLLAARTNNAGGADAAIADSARTAGERLSQAALQTQMQNAQVKQHQQQAGLEGLGEIGNEEQSGALGALGQIAPDVNANTNAENASYDWATDLLDPLMGAASYTKGGVTV